MTSRFLAGLLVFGLVGCGASRTAPTPVPSATVAPRSMPSAPPGGLDLSGMAQGPQGILTQRLNKPPRPFAEEILPAQLIFLADATLKPLKNGPTARTDAKGMFSLKAPIMAGFVMTQPASASAPLAAFFNGSSHPTLSMAATLVAYKLAADVASRSVPLTALDPTKVASATLLIQRDLSKGDLSPDLSLASWPNALDDYTYRKQGEYAQAFNAILPGSVAPRMSR